MTTLPIRPTPPRTIFMPSEEQLRSVYTRIAKDAIKNGSAKQLEHAPRGYTHGTSFDITKKGSRGAKVEVYQVKGELYVRTTVIAPNAKSKWYDVGPAPLFMASGKDRYINY